jgi:hypothetical protein
MSNREDPLQSYVRAALTLQGYEFGEERVAEITAQFARIAAIAATLPADPTAADAADPGAAGTAPAGPAPIFRP